LSMNNTENLMLERITMNKIYQDLTSQNERQSMENNNIELNFEPVSFSKPHFAWSNRLPWYKNIGRNSMMNALSWRYNDKFWNIINDLTHLPTPNNAKYLVTLSRSGVYGSTSWVIDGKYSETGKPILANNIQMNVLSAPNYWYYNHLHAVNQTTNTTLINTIGASIPGIPHVLIGRNEYIAWSFIKSSIDTTDTFILKTNGDTYAVNGSFRAFQKIKEIIHIRDLPSKNMTVLLSDYGPVIDLPLMIFPSSMKYSLSVKWSLDTRFYNGFEVFSQIATAVDWNHFKQIIQNTSSDSLSFLFADTSNNIGYITSGKRIPIRKLGHTGRYPMPGNGSFDWEGFIPPSDLPAIFNPKKGYFIVTNNRIISNEFKYKYDPLSFDWDPGLQASRLEQLILERIRLYQSRQEHRQLNKIKALEYALSIPVAIKIQQDQTSQLFQLYKPIFQNISQRLNESDPKSVSTRHWVDQILNWNGDMSLTTEKQRRSQIPSLFALWYQMCLQVLLPETSTFALRGTVADIYMLDYLSKDIRLATTILEEVVSRPIYAWEMAQKSVINYVSRDYRASMDCVCNRHAYVGGDAHTIKSFNYPSFSSSGLKNSYHYGMQLESYFGPSYSQIMDLSSTCGGDSQFIMPMGPSGRIFSNYYDIWLQWYYKGTYIPMNLCFVPSMTAEVLVLSAQ
jgi:penicillin amidase